MHVITFDAWTDFWNGFVNFFMIPDSSGFNYLTRILIAVGIIIVAFFLIKLVTHLTKRGLGIKKRKGPDVDISAKSFIVQVVKVLLWLAVAMLVIGVLKIDTSGFAGIVSAVTVALGLALQDVVMAFASGIIIIHQGHIKTGEFISVANSYGAQEGIVDKITIFFTYLTTPAGQEVTIPNSNMLKAAVTNYTRLGRRRLDYDVGVSYDADIELAKKVLLDLVKDDPRKIEGDVPVVYVYQLGDYSVGIRIRLNTQVDKYWELYNELSEKVLLTCRKNNIYIPSSTDRAMKN